MKNIENMEEKLGFFYKTINTACNLFKFTLCPTVRGNNSVSEGVTLTIQLGFLPYFPYLFTIQLGFLPYFSYYFTFHLTFIPYFPYHFTIQPTFLPYFSYHFTIFFCIFQILKRFGKCGRKVG
jgi:hypothetical protein